MSATFRQPEISVREELNALQGLKDRSVDPGYGTDIGGGETLWGDGSITGSNSNGSYTKWPNGDLECTMISASLELTLLSSADFYFVTYIILFPHLYIDTPVVNSEAARTVSQTFLVWSGANGDVATTVRTDQYQARAISNGAGSFAVIKASARGKWK